MSITPARTEPSQLAQVRNSKALYGIHSLIKTYHLGDFSVEALKGIHLEVQEGEFLGISGNSGSGKTTLLNLLGCLESPTQGQILFDGIDVHSLNDHEASLLRANKIGFIFQTFNLLPILTAHENIEYPLVLAKIPAAQRAQRVREALYRVGLEKFGSHRPNQLSGGQRQRVAIARALVKNPRVILADEATANLDLQTTESILDLMLELNQKDAVTFVFTSHDPVMLDRAKRRIHLNHGVLEVEK